MNEQERAEQNFLAFQAWVASRTHAHFRELFAQGRLNRGEICRECDFGRLALQQNARIKEALRELEEQLRAVEAAPHASHRQVALAELMTEAAACS